MAKDDAFENAAGPPGRGSAATLYSYFVPAINEPTVREMAKVRWRAGHPRLLLAPTTFQAPPDWRSSHHAWPVVPGLHWTLAFNVADVAVTLVARVACTAQPVVSTASTAAAASSFFIWSDLPLPWDGG